MCVCVCVCLCVCRDGMNEKVLTLLFLPQPELNIVASFDRRGGRIVTGSSKGKVCQHCDSSWPSPIPMLSENEVHVEFFTISSQAFNHS